MTYIQEFHDLCETLCIPKPENGRMQTIGDTYRSTMNLKSGLETYRPLFCKSLMRALTEDSSFCAWKTSNSEVVDIFYDLSSRFEDRDINASIEDASG